MVAQTSSTYGLAQTGRPPRRRWGRWVAGLLVLGLVLATGGWALGREVAAGTAVRGAISGVPAPSGNLPGWRQIFVDDFDGNRISDRWGVYDGVPGGDPGSRWDPGHVRVEDSQLILAGYPEAGKLITGGVSNHSVAQTYGKWEVRFRVDAADEMTMAFLLWPQGGSWPPEIDFFEDAGGDRQHASGFLHYRDGAGRGKIHRSVTADFTKWQTVGVEWLPGVVRYMLNGRPWGTVTGETVPAQPMWLALQAQAGGCLKRGTDVGSACPAGAGVLSADIRVDWVSVYAPDS
jgi:hypothetical protein